MQTGHSPRFSSTECRMPGWWRWPLSGVAGLSPKSLWPQMSLKSLLRGARTPRKGTWHLVTPSRQPLQPKCESVCTGKTKSLNLKSFHQEYRAGGCGVPAQTTGVAESKSNVAAHSQGPQLVPSKPVLAYAARGPMGDAERDRGSAWPLLSANLTDSLRLWEVPDPRRFSGTWVPPHSSEAVKIALHYQGLTSSTPRQSARLQGPRSNPTHLHVVNMSHCWIKRASCRWYLSICVHWGKM